MQEGPADTARLITDIIKDFVRTSPRNRMPESYNDLIFNEPLVQFADGDDPIFTEYKTIISPTHLTPREALVKACDKGKVTAPEHVSVISWILPITEKTRQSNREETRTPTRLWSYTRNYGEKFNDALREYTVEFLTEMGYLAAAPMSQPYFESYTNEKGKYSNWSERHVAYAAGLGTFSLSDGFITESGIAMRCGSVVTDLGLPPSPRLALGPYANCLFYTNGSCKACIARCPSGAITENGHDKIRCDAYIHEDIGYLMEEYAVTETGCGLCQTNVPCEFCNPAKEPSGKGE